MLRTQPVNLHPGVGYSELIDRLIRLGLERHAEKKKNQYSRD
jgi:hypothetical protein